MQIYLSIIIPAYNEANRIERSLIPTIEYLQKKDFTSEILVINDGSNDSTKDVAETYKKHFDNLNIIEYYPNRGKGYAVKTGMLATRGEFRLFMDADYAVPIEYLEKFLETIKNGFDIVIGSREKEQSEIIRHQKFIRERLAKGFGLLQRLVLRLPIKDTQCGFKLFTASAAEKLFSAITLDCAYFDAELLYLAYNNNLKISEIGVTWTHDQETRLPITLPRAIDLVFKLFKIKTSKTRLNK